MEALPLELTAAEEAYRKQVISYLTDRLKNTHAGEFDFATDPEKPIEFGGDEIKGIYLSECGDTLMADTYAPGSAYVVENLPTVTVVEIFYAYRDTLEEIEDEN